MIWDFIGNFKEYDQEGMRSVILKFQTDHGYGEDFDDTLFGNMNWEELSSYWDERNLDGDVDENSTAIIKYFGIKMWECQFCGEDTNGEDILRERMLMNWDVPMREQCIDKDNHPCGGCF